MLTVEFKVTLTTEQEAKVLNWLPGLRVIWNLGLNALESFDDYHYYDKVSKTHVAKCPINYSYKNYQVGKEWISAPYSEIVNSRSKLFIKRSCKEVRNVTTKTAYVKAKNTNNVCFTTADLNYVQGWQNESGLVGYSCPLPQDYKESKIKTPNFFGLSVLTKKEILLKLPCNLADKLLDIPSKYRYGVLSSLGTSWQEYDKSRKKLKKGGIVRGKPRYKKLGTDEVKTLFTPNAKDCVIPTSNDVLKVAGLGNIKVRGLNRRWINSDGSIPKVAVFKLIQRASGWFIQLTGEKTKSLRLRKNTIKATALDPGLNNWNTTDDGIKYENPRFYRNAELRISELQALLTHKFSHNLVLWLNNPLRTIEEIQQHCPSLGESKINLLLKAKSELEISEVVSKSTLNYLKFKVVPTSNKILQLKKQISKLHEITANQRRNFNHKHSTWLVRNNEIVIHEDGLQNEGIRHKAKAKLNEDKSGFNKNNANAKSGLTKSLSDAGHGAFMGMLEQKAKVANRRFERFPAKYTTQECPVCNHRQEMLPNIRYYICGKCNWECDRDQKAAILMMVKSYDKGIVAYEQLSNPVKQILKIREKKYFPFNP